MKPAVGKVVRGEGIMSLPREFLYAGAKSVLMSFWKVDDEFTSRLMPQFYRFYLKKNIPTAKALTFAKRQVLTNEREPSKYHAQHPFFWASFALYGHPGSSRAAAAKAWLYLLAAAVMLTLAGVVLHKRRNVR
ncbi:MAG: CHAT domain-containing protein [candidate division KSB1 bacterium]|nr:CHAT domain-containing protein [candidate division KSB1 bacterium]